MEMDKVQTDGSRRNGRHCGRVGFVRVRLCMCVCESARACVWKR